MQFIDGFVRDTRIITDNFYRADGLIIASV